MEEWSIGVLEYWKIGKLEAGCLPHSKSGFTSLAMAGFVNAFARKTTHAETKQTVFLRTIIINLSSI
jgi:hypothetical protein